VSPFAGQFVYAPIPVKAGASTPRSAEAEPSITVISAASKHPEATFLFLEWLVDKKQQDKLIALGQGGVPVRESSWALPAIKDSSNKTLYDAMKSTLDVGQAKPRIPKYYEIYDQLSGVAQEVGLGKLSPEEGAKKGQAEMLKLCTKCLM
jgi:multiple sugar transport system substrate-binding protein